MCMDEFVKRLYDFMGIYKIFWSQNSDYRYLPIFTDILPIFTDIYRYFTDILSIFTDILPIFFQKFLHKRACSTVSIFRWKNRFFPIFRRKIGDFTDFSPIFPLIFLLCDGRKPIFWRNIGRKNRFFVPCVALIRSTEVLIRSVVSFNTWS